MFLDATTGEDVTSQFTNTNDRNDGGGLLIQSRNGECIPVTIPSDCCAFQIGETSQILSGGILQATPHAVLPPSRHQNQHISRESFALFLEPEFDDIITIPNGYTVDNFHASTTYSDSTLGICPLKSRWKPGQTFGEFHLATTKAFTTL